MNDIQIFDNAEFGTIRAVLGNDGEPVLVAKDVALKLGYETAAHMTRLLDADEKGIQILDTPGGSQQLSVITEAGFYRAVMTRRSKFVKDEAAKETVIRFQRWVTHEVLPALRAKGTYAAPMTREQRVRAALAESNAIIVELDGENRALKAENAELRPKALFADAVAASDGTCLVGELAKMLTQAGTTIGQNRLFERLREDGYLGKSGCNRNVPLQCYIEQGLFKIKETSHVHSDGHVSLSRTPKVTGKGQAYFMKRYGATQAITTA